MTFRATLANHPMLFGAFALVLGFVLFVLLFVVRVGVGGGPVSGRVIDVDTHLPIAGAIVVAHWQKSSFSIADSTSYCVHVETAASAEDGRYHIARWWQFPPILGFDGLTGMDAYFPGYESIHSHTLEAERHPDDVYMKKFVGNDTQRFDYIGYRVFGGMNCDQAGASRRNLFSLFKSALREAAPLARTQEQRTELDRGLRQDAARAWLARPSDAVALTGKPIEHLPKHVREELE
jgi:hypothetical protein